MRLSSHALVDRYSTGFRIHETQRLNRGPDLSSPAADAQTAKATGTDNATATDQPLPTSRGVLARCLALCLAQSGGWHDADSDRDGQIWMEAKNAQVQPGKRKTAANAAVTREWARQDSNLRRR